MQGGSCCGNIARTMVRGCTGSLRWGIQSRAGAAMLIGVSLSSNAVSGSSTGERIDTKEITSIPTTTTVKRREPIRRHNSMGTNYASLASSVNATRLEWWDLVCVRSLCSILARITAFPQTLAGFHPPIGVACRSSPKNNFRINHPKSIADCQVLAYTLKTRRCIHEQRQTP